MTNRTMIALMFLVFLGTLLLVFKRNDRPPSPSSPPATAKAAASKDVQHRSAEVAAHNGSEYRLSTFITPPKEGTQEHARVYPVWATVVKAGWFNPKVMPYEKGMIRELRFPDGKLEKRIATWAITHPNCRTEVVFDPDWNVLSKRAACDGRWIELK